MADGVNKSYHRSLIKYTTEELIRLYGNAYDVSDNDDLYASCETTVKNYLTNVFNTTSVFDEYTTVSHITEEQINLLESFIVANGQYDSTTMTAQKIEEESRRSARNIIYLTIKDVEEETKQAMEAVIHNLNSMHSRAGAQVPFSSINFGTGTTDAQRLVVKKFLDATMAGLGDGETAIFPVSIYRVMDGVNFKPGDPNYDLYKYAMKVTAKRLFPNFAFEDAPFNKSNIIKDDIRTYTAYMGCITWSAVITYKFEHKLYVEAIGRAYERLSKQFLTCVTTDKNGNIVSQYLETGNHVKVYDSNAGEFVQCNKFIMNPPPKKWYKVHMSNGRTVVTTKDHPLPVKGKGRTFVKDLVPGDEIPIVWTQYNRANENKWIDPELLWFYGLIICDGAYNSNSGTVYIGPDEIDIINRITKVCMRFGFTYHIRFMERGVKGTYYEVRFSCGDSDDQYDFKKMFNGIAKNNRNIPRKIFKLNKECIAAFLAGMMDADGTARRTDDHVVFNLGSVNHELAIQQMLLFQAIDVPAKVYYNHYNKNDQDKIRYLIACDASKLVAKYMASGKKTKGVKNSVNKMKTPKYAEVIEVEAYENKNHECCYDVETESDHFDFDGINSHNCRTRVTANVNGPAWSHQRGNLSFTSINLPRLAIKNRNDIDGFFTDLDKMLELAEIQLMDRFEFQSKKKVRNFPFLHGEGVWLDSDKLDPDDTIGEVLKHGSLSIGFVGLAETLIGLTGKHHGESEESQELGLKIIGHMRDWVDQATVRHHLNFTLLATPAENLAGRLLKLDRKKYGVIPGITDKDYYVNSFHVPPAYNISAFDKIALEAPYHAFCNAGHISYVELDGDPSKNIDAIEQILAWMKECGIGYGSINHPVDRDPLCHYTGIIDDVCPRCGRHDGEAIPLDRLRRVMLHINDNADTIGYHGNLDEEMDRMPNLFTKRPEDCGCD